MRDASSLRFESVPAQLAEILCDRAESAMQLLAALVLTDEEAEECFRQRYPEAPVGGGAKWARVMRTDLQSDEWRAELVKAIQNAGFDMNTHPGFPLNVFETFPQSESGDPWSLSAAFSDYENILIEYANGEGPEWDTADKTGPGKYAANLPSMDFWGEKLEALGWSVGAVKLVLLAAGSACFAHRAQLIRYVRKHQGETSEKL
jgi:hypothetical protein